MKKIMLGIAILLSFCNISFAAYNGGQWFPIYDNPEGAYYLNVQYIKCFKTEHELINFWTMTYSRKTGLKMRVYATEDLCCGLECPGRFVTIQPDGRTMSMDAPSEQWHPIDYSESRSQISYILRAIYDNTIYGKPFPGENK